MANRLIEGKKQIFYYKLAKKEIPSWNVENKRQQMQEDAFDWKKDFSSAIHVNMETSVCLCVRVCVK